VRVTENSFNNAAVCISQKEHNYSRVIRVLVRTIIPGASNTSTSPIDRPGMEVASFSYPCITVPVEGAVDGKNDDKKTGNAVVGEEGDRRGEVRNSIGIDNESYTIRSTQEVHKNEKV